MGDKTTNHEMVETPQEETPILAAESTPQPPPPPGDGGGGGGWGGGWGFSAFSYLTDLQKAATVAAEEISRNVALLVDSDASDKDDSEISTGEVETGDESDKRRKAALEKLEKASEDSLLGQSSDIKQMLDGLKVIDHSVENFASGAWQALGNTIKGGSDLVHKLENSAVDIAESIQHGGLPATTGSVGPSILETGKTFTAKGMEVIELLGRETMDLLIAETGINVDKISKDAEGKIDEDQYFEEVTFDRCFYIYGGPEHLEELVALSNHYVMLFNRKKAKLPSDQRSSYDGKLKEVQQIFDLVLK